MYLLTKLGAAVALLLSGIASDGYASSASGSQSILLIHSGHASGTIGATSFHDAAYSISALGKVDETTVTFVPPGYTLEHASASISIEGVGEFDFVSPTRTFVANLGSDSVVGFARGGLPGFHLTTGPRSQVFSDWQIATTVEQVSGTGVIHEWTEPGGGVDPSLAPLETTGGGLLFDYVAFGGVQATFSASIVPTPAASALAAFACLVALNRRRR